jgi:hypothetical protein
MASKAARAAFVLVSDPGPLRDPSLGHEVHQVCGIRGDPGLNLVQEGRGKADGLAVLVQGRLAIEHDVVGQGRARVRLCEGQ